MKQTAVEWLVCRIIQDKKHNDISDKVWDDIFEQAKEIEKQQKGYSEEDLKQFAFECVGNFLSNRENELEIELVNVISDRNNKLFEQFKNK